MASLSPASKRALANLRAFGTPRTNWYKCPRTRRAAVLILLFADRKGDLRVILTIRSATLKNYASQAALPGGKADTLTETPFTIARREAHEEIGLPTRDADLPPGYSVEHLAELPANLAMTELGVRPCVAFLSTPAPSETNKEPDAGRDILPRLDAREVAAVFTADFGGFLRERLGGEEEEGEGGGEGGGVWYKGSWHSWHESAWRMHQFFVPVRKGTVFLADAEAQVQKERRPKSSTMGTTSTTMTKNESTTSSTKPAKHPPSSSSTSSSLQPPLPASFYKPAPPPSNTSSSLATQSRYRVFGMTARILVDAARVAYGTEPDFEHNSHFGDEEMIDRLLAIGRLQEKRVEGETLTREVMVKAGRVKI